MVHVVEFLHLLQEDAVLLRNVTDQLLLQTLIQHFSGHFLAFKLYKLREDLVFLVALQVIIFK